MITAVQKNKIHALAVEQIKKDVKALKEQSRGESIYAFGLGIVSEITGFFLAANTLEALSKRLAQKGGEEDVSFFWHLSEWAYSETADNKLYEYLATFLQDIKPNEYEKALADYANTLIKALKTCDEQGIFGEGEARKNVIVYIQYADASDENFDEISSKQINAPEQHLLFKERWNVKKNNLTKQVQLSLKHEIN